MLAFYRQRFSNAADFTFFMVGAFKIDDALPLLAQYVGSCRRPGRATSQLRDVGLHFPASTRTGARRGGARTARADGDQLLRRSGGRSRRNRRRSSAATTVLETALRDILREELGQTYTVSVGLSQPLPQRGAGHIQVRFGAAPENLEAMTARVMKEIKRLQDEGPSADLTNRAKETARRNYESALKQNDYWLGRLESIHLLGRDPGEILTRNERIDAVTPQILQEVFKTYFPADRSTIVTLVPAPTL